MKDLAPEITRQRLLLEGFYTIEVNEATIEAYFKELAGRLQLRVYGKATIHATGGRGKEINEGYDAFVPLIDSGISLYVWSNAKFLSVIIYTCKAFDEKEAIEATREFFKIDKVEHHSF